MKILPGSQKGSVLLSLLFVMPFLALILISYLGLTTSNYRLARGDLLRTHAQMAADAGLDIAVSAINAAEDGDWTGTGGEVELHNAEDVRTTYEVTVVDGTDDEKEVTAIGRTYWPWSSAPGNATSTVNIKVNLRPVSSGNFSIVTGVGGLYMSNSAKILGGDVHVNGEVSLSNTSQIGLSTSPVNLSVAHQTCPVPPDDDYPQLCGSGDGEPITINHQAHIYGDVRANNQVSTAGMTSPGLTASSGVATLPLPTHDRDAQKAAISSTITSSAAGCSSGTNTWNANTKITGNVVVSGSCQVTVMGDVWITGTLTVRNTAQLIVSDTLGTTRPNIMIDGSSAQFQNSSLLRSNTDDTGFQILTYRSSPSCSPDCADVTGQELYDSRNLTTIELEQSSSAPNTIFYARWTRVTVGNTGAIGALVGQTVSLTNSGTITFGTTVSSEGTMFWVIDGYRRVF